MYDEVIGDSSREIWSLSIPNSCKLGCNLDVSLVGKYEVAFAQHRLEVGLESEFSTSVVPLKFAEEKEIIKITGDNFTYIFNKHYGNFENLITEGQERLADIIKLSVWRAPTDNNRNIKYKWDYLKAMEMGKI